VAKMRGGTRSSCKRGFPAEVVRGCEAWHPCRKRGTDPSAEARGARERSVAVVQRTKHSGACAARAGRGPPDAALDVKRLTDWRENQSEPLNSGRAGRGQPRRREDPRGPRRERGVAARAAAPRRVIRPSVRRDGFLRDSRRSGVGPRAARRRPWRLAVAGPVPGRRRPWRLAAAGAVSERAPARGRSPRAREALLPRPLV
jgi:hypothetical protein